MNLLHFIFIKLWKIKKVCDIIFCDIALKSGFHFDFYIAEKSAILI